VKEKGFVSGNINNKEIIHFGVVASTQHPQVKYDHKNSYAQFAYSDSPTKVIGYVSCHDNNTLYDKLKIANPTASEKEILAMHKLANAIVLTAQSVPFLHMGEEMKRTKNGVENSFNAPDSINKIDWNWKHENQEIYHYYKSLIALRKKHPAFKMTTEKSIQEHLEFLNINDPLLVGYTLKNNANGDSWKTIRVYYNGDVSEKQQQLDGFWRIACNGGIIDLNGTVTINNQMITIPAHSVVILYQE
jgi:pullulanase